MLHKIAQSIAVSILIEQAQAASTGGKGELGDGSDNDIILAQYFEAYNSPEWNYFSGGTDWKLFYPDCQGKQQSPVNIIKDHYKEGGALPISYYFEPMKLH